MAVDTMAVDAMAEDAMALETMAAISQKVDTMAAKRKWHTSVRFLNRSFIK